LHEDGSVQKALDLLVAKGMAYEKDGALWFKSTDFGDDKDRVVRKSTGELTYIAADIAYHKNKFDRGYDLLIDILGHDHHGYVKRLKATMEALGFNPDQLEVILYQLVNIKENDVAVRMSKRAGNFTKLSDVIEEVGTDVARFFYLNRKADMTLDFDLATALKKTDENPVYYIQYAFVRISSLLDRAAVEEFGDWIAQVRAGSVTREQLEALMPHVTEDERDLLKKMCLLENILRATAQGHQSHMLSYYALELAQCLHSYYTRNKVIDRHQIAVSQLRMLMVHSVQHVLSLCLDLLGISKPERM
jgi:arginyl-tRNA synthetase